MNKAILKIIDTKIADKCKDMTNAKRQAYRLMLYVGIQSTICNRTQTSIADETGYSDSYIKSLIKKWIRLREEGDIMVHTVSCAVIRLPKSKLFGTYEDPVLKDINSGSCSTEAPKVKKVLGFIITPEQEQQEREAKRSSILFMESFGCGRSPRTRGEYYTPGTNPQDIIEEEQNWLPLTMAALYCGCSELLIIKAAQDSIIRRRTYKCSGSHRYYEYSVKDLDRFIETNNLK